MAWFNKKSSNRDEIEKEIDLLLEEMAVTDRSSEDYQRMAEAVETLGKAKAHVRDSEPIDWNDILVNVSGVLIPIILIMNFEKLDVIATKAFGLIRKVH